MRPTDWSVVACESDPTPGDPETVRLGSAAYSSVADAIRSAVRTLRRLNAGQLTSEAMASVMTRQGEALGDVGQAEQRYRAAGSALATYAAALERIQVATVEVRSQALVDQRQWAVDTELQRHYEGLAEGTDDADDWAYYRQVARRYDNDATAAQERLNAHADAVARLVVDQDEAAHRAIEEIEDTILADGLNDGFWTRALIWVTDAARWVSSVAGVLALIAAFIPVVGPLIAGALLIAAAVAGIAGALAHGAGGLGTVGQGTSASGAGGNIALDCDPVSNDSLRNDSLSNDSLRNGSLSSGSLNNGALAVLAGRCRGDAVLGILGAVVCHLGLGAASPGPGTFGNPGPLGHRAMGAPAPGNRWFAGGDLKSVRGRQGLTGQLRSMISQAKQRGSECRVYVAPAATPPAPAVGQALSASGGDQAQAIRMFIQDRGVRILGLRRDAAGAGYVQRFAVALSPSQATNGRSPSAVPLTRFRIGPDHGVGRIGRGVTAQGQLA
jgi:hypothetical protein